MQAVITIVGRPNVGKSTLFNCLTKSTRALVADVPGVTRDRLYGFADIEDHSCIVVDTGGMVDINSGLEASTRKQTEVAIQDADVILWVVDAKEGLTSQERELAQILRKFNKSLILVINKCESIAVSEAGAEFQELGFKEFVLISTAHRRGLNDLAEKIVRYLPENNQEIMREIKKEVIKVAIVGKPNVGKSTLMNRLLGEERVIVYDAPGTTRDSIYIPFEKNEKSYIFIDTAGVRRRSRIQEGLEKFSILKTLKAIEEAQVVLFLLDATSVITDQDLHLLGFVDRQGKSLIIAVNKWDHLSKEKRTIIKKEMDRRLDFLGYAQFHFISALHGTNVGLLFKSIARAYQSAMRTVSTSLINEWMSQAVEAHQPPLVKGRRVKLRYAHLGGHHPPTIIVHGNQVASLPRAYQRYLESFFRKKLNLIATPVRLAFKEGENPYQQKTKRGK